MPDGLSDALLKSVGPTAGLVVGLLLGLYVISSDPWRGCATGIDTVVVSRWDTLALPPCTVYVRTKPIIVRDTLFKERVDSLIAHSDKDSLIRELSTPQTAQVPFRTVKDSVEVIGRIIVDYFPLDRTLEVVHQIDTLTVPKRTEYITTTQVVEVADAEVVIYSIVGGLIVGGAIVYTLR